MARGVPVFSGRVHLRWHPPDAADHDCPVPARVAYPGTSHMTVDPENELVTAAADVLDRMGDGLDGLRALEWEPWPKGDDQMWLPTTLALMRAQGRTLTATPAVAMTRAEVLSPQAGPSGPTVVAGFEIEVADDLVQMVLPADIEGVDRVVVDLPLIGLGLVDVSNLSVDRSGAQPLDPGVASRMS